MEINDCDTFEGDFKVVANLWLEAKEEQFVMELTETDEKYKNCCLTCLENKNK